MPILGDSSENRVKMLPYPKHQTYDWTDPDSIKGRLKRVPIIRRAARGIFGIANRRKLELLQSLEAFAPNSAGTSKELVALALLDAKQIFPVLELVLKSAGRDLLPVVKADAFPENESERDFAARLAELFNKYGSDKSRLHNYENIYGPVLSRCGKVEALLEVGLGTNNKDVVSNMGAKGAPGASLRAFRDFLPGASINGADVDRRILFTEDRIKTFFVDQTDPYSFNELAEGGPASYDLVIDDGLHSPAANLAVLNFALQRVRPGGWIVVEDIAASAVPVWQVVAALLAPQWRCQIVDAHYGYLFVAHRGA